MEPDVMRVPQGSFRLRRFPDPGERSPLRAWDAADEYLLHHLAEGAGVPSGESPRAGDGGAGAPDVGGRTLVVNDSFGALALPLARAPAGGASVASWSDGVDAFLGLRANAEGNGLDPETIEQVPSTRTPEGPFPLVLLKVPKSLDLLEHQLRALRTVVGPETRILAGGMSRHLGRNVVDLFQRVLGPAQASLARKKARVITASLDSELDPGPSSFPCRVQVPGELAGGCLAQRGFEAVTHAGVFSSARVDSGTRRLLEALPDPLPGSRIVDLGCGSGILGTAAAARTASAELCFTDRSFLAVESARETFRSAFGGGRPARFLPTLGLAGVERGWADVVLNNPPFHDRHAVGDAIAWGMFHEARRALGPGGSLYVVGNRHLGYHAKLKRIFGNCETVASDPKFVVLRAVRS